MRADCCPVPRGVAWRARASACLGRGHRRGRLRGPAPARSAAISGSRLQVGCGTPTWLFQCLPLDRLANTGCQFRVTVVLVKTCKAFCNSSAHVVRNHEYEADSPASLTYSTRFDSRCVSACRIAAKLVCRIQNDARRCRHRGAASANARTLERFQIEGRHIPPAKTAAECEVLVASEAAQANHYLVVTPAEVSARLGCGTQALVIPMLLRPPHTHILRSMQLA